jgi:hypothetical protein
VILNFNFFPSNFCCASMILRLWGDVGGMERRRKGGGEGQKGACTCEGCRDLR